MVIVPARPGFHRQRCDLADQGAEPSSLARYRPMVAPRSGKCLDDDASEPHSETIEIFGIGGENDRRLHGNRRGDDEGIDRVLGTETFAFEKGARSFRDRAIGRDNQQFVHDSIDRRGASTPTHLGEDRRGHHRVAAAALDGDENRLSPTRGA